MCSIQGSSLTPSPEELLAAALRGEAAPWPPDPSGEVERRVLDGARWHGVSAMLADAIHRRGSAAGWPDRVLAALAAEAHGQALTEALRYVELQRVLAALVGAGVHPLLLKGAHLAYTHYPSPCLRPCSDVDLLIREADRPLTRHVMEDLGYRRGTHVSGEFVTHQFRYERDDAYRLRHEFDIHWRIANPQLFAHLLSFEELAREAVPIPALGGAAQGLPPVYALLLACIHRVAHHHNSQRLIWIYDIHLLSSGMHVEQFRRFAALAADKQVRAVCASGLQLAERWFGTEVPSFVIRELDTNGRPEEVEPTGAFLKDGRRKVDVLISDLRCLPGWRSRLRLVREHLFPPATYILDTRRTAHPALLPLLYAHRIARGAAKWFSRDR